MKSIHDKEPPRMCLGFLIMCCNPSWEVTPSVIDRSNVVMLLLYQRPNFALKSPIMKVRKELFTIP